MVLIPNVTFADRAERLKEEFVSPHSARWLAPLPKDLVKCAAAEKGCDLVILVGWTADVAQACAEALPGHKIFAEMGTNGYIRIGAATHACPETLEALLEELQQAQ